MTTPLLSLQGITKRYPGVVANQDVSLTVMPGQAHAVLGENGAGKSTLMKIIYGSVKPDEGKVLFNGQPVIIRNPQEARKLGISMVFQHFSLFDTLTVAENVWLGLDKSLSLAEVTERIVAKASEYGLDLEPERPVHTLSVGEMQRVEIIRALLTEPKLLILDEPTSVLTPQAVEKLFVVLHKLVSQGVSILYISHKLHEIRALCSACTVLRGGKLTGVCDPREETNASLSRLMIGAEPPALQHVARAPGEVVLSVQGLSLTRQDPFGVDLDGINLQVRAGEVVGLAGVSGNGQRELMWVLSGEDTRAGVQCGAASVSLSGQAVALWGRCRAGKWVCILCPKSAWAGGLCRPLACRKTSCSRAARPWVRAAGCAWWRWSIRRAASSTASRSRRLAQMPQRSRCQVAICKSSLWGVRSALRRSCSSSRNPLGAWTWAQQRRFAPRFWRCATRVVRCWW